MSAVRLKEKQQSDESECKSVNGEWGELRFPSFLTLSLARIWRRKIKTLRCSSRRKRKEIPEEKSFREGIF
jgi:hypothetical protein